MKAYHFLMGNMETGSGTEGPWTIGEEREIEGDLGLCCRGYHSSKSWLDTLNYAPGAMACIVDIPDSRHGTIVGNDKQVSPRRKLLAARDATQVLQLFVCDCAERALRVAEVTDEKLWAITRVARRYALGLATREELLAARIDASYFVSIYAARAATARVYIDACVHVNAARAVARTTDDAVYAAVNAARTAQAKERAWQRRRLNWYMKKLFEEV